MVTLTRQPDALALAHVVVYAKNERRRQAIVRALEADGHSCRTAGTPAQLRRLLDHQRFDAGALIVRDQEESDELGPALERIRLPTHTIVIGAASALPHLRRRRGDTLRFGSGHLTAGEITKLTSASIRQGTWDEVPVECEENSHSETLELETIIESAATAVYAQAKRKQQRFTTVVAASDGRVVGSRSALRGIFRRLLGTVVELAPIGAAIAINATDENGEWQISIGAHNGGAPRPSLARTSAELEGEHDALKAISQDIRDQGGILWVELAGPAALSLCFTLPLPAEALQHA